VENISLIKYLVDTNIWLEILLDQEKCEEASKFLKIVDTNLIAISDFSLHSILLILTKFKKFNEANLFLEDLINSNVMILSIVPNDIKELINTIKQYNLDFDDAYQYFLVKKYNLTLVSFDKDFDKTDIYRKTPEELIIKD
jgi:predicted nucleic acid-binding protein